MYRTAADRWVHLAAGLMAFLILALALFANQQAVHQRGNLADSHLFEFHGWCIAQGATPYREIWDNKPPGIWLVNAAAFAIVGEHPWTGHLPAALATAGTLGAFVILARRIYGAAITLPAAVLAAALLAHFGFECGANRTETYVVCAEVGGVALLLCAISCAPSDPRQLSLLVLAGLFLGAAPWFKQVGVAALAGSSVYLLLTAASPTRGGIRAASRRLIPLWLAAALPTLAIVGWLAARGALADGFFAFAKFNQAYFAIGDATWVDLPRALRDYRDSYPLMILPLILAALGCVTPLHDPTNAARSDAKPADLPHPSPLPLLIVWFTVAAYLALVSVGRLSYHLAPLLPPLALLALRPVAWLLRGSLTTALQDPARILGLACFAAACLQIVAQSARIGGWIDRGGGPAWPARAASLERVIDQGRAVAAACEPRERVYVWGWAPGPYRFAYRLPSTRFATLEKVFPLRPHAAFIEAEARAALVADPPRVFAISRRDLEALRIDGTPVANLLALRYEERCEMDGVVVLRRTDERGPAASTVSRISQPAGVQAR
ncbi:MAG: glycosyltransferase family 39 protein [Phycisphaerae bacterium]|nr:glycosyltransferase family 39 protein [Phycisphaerae bacterium]